MRLAVGRILGVLLATSLLSASVRAQDPIDLGTLPGYTRALAKGINGRGDIVGQATGGGVGLPDQAVLWQRRPHRVYVAQALPALPGFDRSIALDFVGGRVPIGYSQLSGTAQYRAVMWRHDPAGGRMPVELEPPAGLTDARAYSASRRGQIVGEAWNPARLTPGGAVEVHAISWRPGRGGGEVCDLGIPEGFESATAFDVNAAGDVVGTAVRSDHSGTDVIVWLRPHRRSGECDPRPFVLGGRDDLPRKQSPAINERGDVVARADALIAGPPAHLASRALGWARVGRRYRAPFELPVPDRFTDAYPADVSSRGEVVGTAVARVPGVATSARGVSWRYVRGHWRTTLLGGPSGSSFVTTERISERGEIVGSTPTPAPGSSGALLWRASHECHERDDERDDDSRLDRHEDRGDDGA